MVRRNTLRQTLNVKLSQRLAMTPSLLQKIELLTLNCLELSELLNQELAQNPVLEEVTEGGGEREASREKEQKKEEESPYEDFDFDYFFGEYLGDWPRTRERPDYEEDRPSFEAFLANPSSLIDHLNWQLNLTEVSPELHDIAYFIIGNIDEDGYLTVSLEEISETLGAPLEKVREALAVVQELDPVGVGARDLRECLLLQLRAAGLEGSLEERLVRDFLPQLEAKKYKEISQELGCGLEEISRALEVIRGLSPKPGARYSSKEPVYIQPDVYIYKVDDEYQIMLNDDGLPRLRLSRAYRELLKGKETGREAKSFIRERFRSALDLLKSVDQRQQTIYRVCRSIVRRQREFLDKGLLHLKPMLIKDVAEELGLHSSTISRVVANKYAHTPQGILELRKFFTVGVEGYGGENVSILHVKEKIRRIVEKEDPRRPLSDQKIARLLNRDGIQITRRTVAKYRDQMNIPGSRERKANHMIEPS